MKILHVTSTFYPATYWGGPVFSTHALCNALAHLPDTELRVLTSDMAGPCVSQRLNPASFPVRFPGGYDVYYTRRLAPHDVAPGLLVRLWGMIGWADVVLLTGVYTFPTIPTLFLCKLRGKPLLWSPRGALQAVHEWRGARRQKSKKIWEALCRLAAPKNCVLHVTSEVEKEASLARLPGFAAAIIPNAVEVPESLPDREWRPNGKFRLQYISRIDPKKGLENLLAAMTRLDSNTVLEVYGAGDAAYIQSLEARIAELGLSRQVHFHGHVDGSAKTAAFAGADLFVLPSYSENFGMAVAEALAHGVPTVVGHGAPWSELDARGCGAWVSNDPESLAHAIETLKAQDLTQMGLRGREWMLSDFNWENRARDILALLVDLKEERDVTLKISKPMSR